MAVPKVSQVTDDLADIGWLIKRLRDQYPWAHSLGLTQMVSSGEKVSGGGISNPTADIVEDPRQQRLRDACRTAAQQVHVAQVALNGALLSLHRAMPDQSSEHTPAAENDKVFGKLVSKRELAQAKDAQKRRAARGEVAA